MKFTLAYEGLLPSTGNQRSGSSPPGKLAAVWSIRNQIAPQMRRLFETKPVLAHPGTTEARAAVLKLSRRIKRDGLEFIALVRPQLNLACALDIEMLVNHDVGSVVTGAGDLDNRIKTLLDGLRLPKGAHEIKTNQPVETPCFCLFEDDALLTGLCVKMDRNYAATVADPQHVRLNIKVIVEPGEHGFENQAFVGD
jgi:hypothetical protein